MRTSQKLLLIEDENKLRRILAMVLDENGFDVVSAENGKHGIDLWKEHNPDIVVSDIRMKPLNGFDVLAFGQTYNSTTPVIILTAFGTVETAVSAMKLGAFDFLTKPVDHDQLVDLVNQALASNTDDMNQSIKLIGASKVMKKIRKNIKLFASTDTSVLITGESGTGKELAAQTIHNFSSRSNSPMVRVNCAAIPKDLLESVLFGHRKGAFTGATSNRLGAFAQADQGIIFLDEIGDLPLELQPKLLHAVEEKEITPVGSTNCIPVSLKILSATNLDIGSMIQNKQFRSDLYYRLNTVNLTMPPLRTRLEDIGELTDHFLKLFSKEFSQPLKKLSNECIDKFYQHHWPGNVRELKNSIERAVLLCPESCISKKYLMLSDNRSEESLNKDTIPDLVVQEQNLLLKALTTCQWNQSKAARKLGITRSALRYRLQKYGIKPGLN